MNCDKAMDFFLLHGAGELPEKESGAMRTHLEQCASCRQMAEEMSALQGRVQSVLSVPSVQPSPDFDQRVMAAVRQLPVRRSFWRRLILPSYGRSALTLIGAAASLTCAFALGFWGGGRQVATRPPAVTDSGPQMVSHETLHQAYQELRNGPDRPEVASDAPDLVSAALTRRVRFGVKAVDLRPEGATLIGGDSLRLHGSSVALMRYKAQGQQVALLQMDASELAFSPIAAQSAQSERYFVEKRNGITCVAWRSGNVNNVMIAQNLPMHTLFHLACHTCQKQTD